MKPSPHEQDALGRRPVAPDWQRYESRKREWLQAHPKATAREVERAMRRIARECGV